MPDLTGNTQMLEDRFERATDDALAALASRRSREHLEDALWLLVEIERRDRDDVHDLARAALESTKPENDSVISSSEASGE